MRILNNRYGAVRETEVPSRYRIVCKPVAANRSTTGVAKQAVSGDICKNQLCAGSEHLKTGRYKLFGQMSRINKMKGVNDG